MKITCENLIFKIDLLSGDIYNTLVIIVAITEPSLWLSVKCFT